MSVLDARQPESDELQIICKPQPTPIVAFPFSRAFTGITGLRLGLWGGLATLPRGVCVAASACWAVRLRGGRAAARRRGCSGTWDPRTGLWGGLDPAVRTQPLSPVLVRV